MTPATAKEIPHAPHTSDRGLPQLRHHGAHRCRQDHDDRARPLLHRQEPQDRRGARRRRHHGLDGAGAGARHHHHVGRDHRVLERQAPQHHRHARPRRLHHRSGALAARARRRRVRARFQPGRGAADRDGVAPRRPLQRPAHRFLQQDGQDRRGLLPVPEGHRRSPRRQAGRDPAADRRRKPVQGHHRSRPHGRRRVGRRDARRRNITTSKSRPNS